VAAFAARGVLRARLRALLPEPGSEMTGSGGSLPFERALLRTVFINVSAMKRLIKNAVMPESRASPASRKSAAIGLPHFRSEEEVVNSGACQEDAASALSGFRH
jgi:hypothetical protein